MDNEYQTEPVPDHASIVWWRIALMNAIFSISLPIFLGGLELVAVTSASTFVWGTIVGGVFLTCLAAPMAVIGTKTRLSSYMLARIAFGVQSSNLLNFAFAISLLGWFGINIELFGDAMARLLVELGIGQVPLFALQALGGVMMTTLTYLGLRTINMLTMVVTPLLVLVTVLMLLTVLDGGAVGTIMGLGQAEGLSFGDVMSATVGAVAVGAVIMPDTCRFVRGTAGGVGVAVITYAVTAPAVTLVAGLAGLVTGQTDLLPLMLALGLGFGAFAIVFGGSTTLNALNLYSATLSMGTVLPKARRELVVLVGGIGGTIFAFLGILDSFIPFLLYLTVIFIPVGAVILADYFMVGRKYYGPEFRDNLPNLRWPALLAWGGGSGVALAAMEGLITLTGTVAIDAIVVSFGLYLALSKAWPEQEGLPA
ncbi:cytosine permease [uncultured Erythrobacter sp.]|uniref:purine-cytosine permease family protein n=1 Tax=uncultured Erythrobacter sp. TaxID=263913 RepID=UPI0026030B51|nr:cytosine permease [uncultured Erythrobacter sp.]